MVQSNVFKEIIQASTQYDLINLPVSKEVSLKISYDDVKSNSPVIDRIPQLLPFADSEVTHADIAGCRRLSAIHEDCKAIYEVTLNITGSKLGFKPGDTIGILPENTDTDVDSILSHLGLLAHADTPYTLSVDNKQKKIKTPSHIPLNSTLRHTLKYFIEIRSLPKKLFLLALSKYTTKVDERKVLEFLCSKEGSAAYSTYVLNENLCILDFFSYFKSCRPPIEVLFSHLPGLLPRPYSIVNSCLKDKNMLKICFSVMYLSDNRKGLTTSWLEEILLRDNIVDALKSLNFNNHITERNITKIPFYKRKNLTGFHLPVDLEKPLILIGCGTGLAPFIGFLEEIECLKLKLDQKNETSLLGDTWLFFGCRNPKLDFIYEKELARFMEDGVLNNLTTTFSRVNNEIKYVQDALLENGKEVMNYINSGARIYICGDATTIVTKIKNAFVNILMKYDDRTKDEAEQILLEFQKEKRYCLDVWN